MIRKAKNGATTLSMVQSITETSLGYAIVCCSSDTNIVKTCVRSNNKRCNQKHKPIMT